MKRTYLFDWGDTLMVDFPEAAGKMCDWERVEIVDGAAEALKYLSKKAKIYIATGASESLEEDIEKAFHRVGLAKYVNGYFCKSNIGCRKGHPDFIPVILKKLQLDKTPKLVTMVGDSLKSDIEPALKAGIKAIWLNRDNVSATPPSAHIITSLKELCDEVD